MAVIVCAHCGEQIKRNLKRVKGHKGVYDYHGECWSRREQTRRNEAHRLAYYRASKVDREDSRELAKVTKVIGRTRR